MESLRRAIALNPAAADYHSNLGVVFADAGQFDEAIAEFQSAVSLRPENAETLGNLGNALQAKGELDEAIGIYGKALALRPNLPGMHFSLGNALRARGRWEQAIAAYQQALAITPGYADAWVALGVVFKEAGELEQAIAAYRRALALRPGFAEAWSNLGAALQEKGELDEAIAAYQRALALRPDLAEAHSNLGNALKETGQLDEAIASYRRSESLKPDSRTAGNLLYALYAHPDYGPRRLLEEHSRWNETYAKPRCGTAAPGCDWPNTAGGGCATRKLRIGYVSPDLRDHPVGRFLLPLLEHHDRSGFEIVCYTDVRRPDAVTHRLAAHADIWRNSAGLSDDELAAIIRQDRIDILVDLAMHTKDNRLLVFARTPAPVQVTYLAYCGTTGLQTMDYRLTDPYLDPPGASDEFYSEKSIWLPHTYWCYTALPKAGEVGPLPALSARRVTFGCLNNFAKVTRAMVELWGQILQRTSGSRLVLHCRKGSHRERVIERFGRMGVGADRIELVDFLPTAEYLDRYRQIDIALDPFPYGGGTTTFDALWMGVPVVSLAGQTAVSRAGLSILSNLGLANALVARTPEQYLQIATALAFDLSRLAGLRSTLRDRMRSSPLMDAPAFARDLEAAFRDMWQSTLRESAPSPSLSRSTEGGGKAHQV